ncbi:MAG: hypothetical protein JJ900_02830 [Rhodospirillales bacterium]|nr:hypothetical protein [Rhodospirillales bacterium]MBO6785758.1 hypothetical protein [Rhodospirillales bacterium]
MAANDPVRNLALAALDADEMLRDLLVPGADVRLSFSELYRYVNDPAFELSPAAQDKLSADPAAAADLERLIAARPFAYMPRQAAASTSGAVRREVERAVLTLTPSRATPAQVYLGVEIVDLENADVPTHLFVRSPSGAWLRQALPAFSGNRAQVLLEANSAIANALSTPESEVYLR